SARVAVRLKAEAPRNFLSTVGASAGSTAKAAEAAIRQNTNTIDFIKTPPLSQTRMQNHKRPERPHERLHDDNSDQAFHSPASADPSRCCSRKQFAISSLSAGGSVGMNFVHSQSSLTRYVSS